MRTKILVTTLFTGVLIGPSASTDATSSLLGVSSFSADLHQSSGETIANITVNMIQPRSEPKPSTPKRVVVLIQKNGKPIAQVIATGNPDSMYHLGGSVEGPCAKDLSGATATLGKIEESPTLDRSPSRRDIRVSMAEYDLEDSISTSVTGRSRKSFPDSFVLVVTFIDRPNMSFRGSVAVSFKPKARKSDAAIIGMYSKETFDRTILNSQVIECLPSEK
jgi:hypothetical protein